MEKKYIGYKVEAGGDFDFPIWFRGFITWFDGEQILVYNSDRFEKKEDAWKWIAERLKEDDF